MTEQDSYDLPEEADVRAAAVRLLGQRKWQLLGADELAEGARALLATGAFDRLDGAVMHVYANALYRACAGDEGGDRQQLGYTELFRYLYDAARHHAHDLSDDEHAELANQTVAELFYRLGVYRGPEPARAVRNPGAFLAVALQQLRNCVRRWRGIQLGGGERMIAGLPAGADSDPVAVALSGDFTGRVHECFERALERHPRAKLQLKVVWMRQIEGHEYETIAEALAMNAANVRVLHARGVARLRDDKEWRALAGELGLIDAGAGVAVAEGRRTR